MSTSESAAASSAKRTEYLLCRVLTVEPEEWRASANCLGVDPELFYPERGQSAAPAKRVCRGCEVRAECLDYALSRGERVGILGWSLHAGTPTGPPGLQRGAWPAGTETDGVGETTYSGG